MASATAGHAATPAATPTPTHFFAPYFEAYNGDDPATLSQQSGAKYLTMAFIQAATKGSCTVYWNGDTSMPISSATFGTSISKIRANGGDVIPSFGGYTADNTGTEIADSCTNVSSIAAAYENVITTYDVSRIDLDTEDNSLTNSAGIDRRNKAIKMVEDWAAANGRTIQFTYTLPTTTSGLASSGLKVLQNAVSNNARIDTVNIMTFDYYDNAGTHNMANDTKTAATGLKNQLATLYPSKTAAQLWGMIGVTEMPGIDDFGAAETFQTADAAPVLSWAQSTGINEISFWALQRDNGGCPGTGGSDTCSGVSQSQWFFSNTFEPFTSGTTTPTNDFSIAASPTSGSVQAGASASTTISTAVTSGSAQTVSLTASGAPTGTTLSISPTSVTAGGSATLTATTSASTPAGTYPITITGT
ncbi:MAG: chitinase, partial [Catenulispora sp.]|nr:chitinase [Catenulispora sp.]